MKKLLATAVVAGSMFGGIGTASATHYDAAFAADRNGDLVVCTNGKGSVKDNGHAGLCKGAAWDYWFLAPA